MEAKEKKEVDSSAKTGYINETAPELTGAVKGFGVSRP